MGWSDWFKTENGDEESKTRVSRDKNDGSVRIEKLTRDSSNSETHYHDTLKISTDGESKLIHSEDHKDKK